jgi:hypothetical protein
MKLFKTAPMITCIVLLGVMLNPAAKADEWNKKTIVKLSGPVEIPGVHLVGWGVLPAGTYVFKLLDSSSNRHIVQIFSEDEKTVYATILAIPNYRIQATDKTVITFAERPAGQPEALRAWFYPGRNWGEEFVYPKAQAVALAKQSKMPVLFTSEEYSVEVAESAKLAEEPVITRFKTAPILAIQPSGEEVQLAQVVTAPPPEVAGTAPAPSSVSPSASNESTGSTAAAAQRLPDTASQLPFYGLAGLLSLGAASLLRLYTQRKR